MNGSEIRADIEAIEGDATLRDEAAFARRVDAIDRLELHVIDRIDGLLASGADPDALPALRAGAERLMAELEAVDDRLFDRLRMEIRAGGCRGAELARRIGEYAGTDSADGIGYDTADEFVNGLLTHRSLPEETVALEPEMVAYHKTPVRIIFDVAERLAADDVFCDIGSGLGQVPILVHLLRGVGARGIELEPAFCDYARQCAEDLHLPRVRFIHADARTADYAKGSVFFLYTPFRGRILADVLARLESEARRRPIRVFTYGPCTPVVAGEPWLRCVDGACDDPHRLAVFERR
jgi:SAM-dependent methyltransferase